MKILNIKRRWFIIMCQCLNTQNDESNWTESQKCCQWENLHFGNIFNVFGPYLCTKSLECLKLHIRFKLNIIIILHIAKTTCQGETCFWLYSRDQTPIYETWIFLAFLVCFQIISSSDALTWTTWNLDRMYSRYTYLKIKNFF